MLTMIREYYLSNIFLGCFLFLALIIAKDDYMFAFKLSVLLRLIFEIPTFLNNLDTYKKLKINQTKFALKLYRYYYILYLVIICLSFLLGIGLAIIFYNIVG